MNKAEYMKQLKEALSTYDEGLKNEILEDYEEHFQIGLQNGKTEDQICEELGSIDELLKELGFDEMDKKSKAQATFQNESYKGTKKEQIQTQGDETSTQTQGPTRLVIRSKFSKVEVHSSNNNQINLDWKNYGDQRQQRMYQFRSWLEGNTIYGEVTRDSVNFGNFNGPKTTIYVQLPDGFPEVEIHSMSGDTEILGVLLTAVNITSASGDISIDNSNINQCRVETKSGDVDLHNTKTVKLNTDTASGDLSISNCEIETLMSRTLSGDNHLMQVQGKNLTASTASGDLVVQNVNADDLILSSLSGDGSAQGSTGNTIKLYSKSGDVNANVNFSQCSIESISGDATLTNHKECIVTARSVSGDVRVKLFNITGYEANLHTVSGSCDMYFNGNSTHVKSGSFIQGTGACKINARSVSGDISIEG